MTDIRLSTETINTMRHYTRVRFDDVLVDMDQLIAQLRATQRERDTLLAEVQAHREARGLLED